MEPETRNVLQVEPPEPAHRSIRLEAVAHHPLRVIKTELADDRSVEDDQGFASRGVAAVFDAIDRVDHGLDECDQDGHVFGPAAGHHAVDCNAPDGRFAPVRQRHTEHLGGIA